MHHQPPLAAKTATYGLMHIVVAFFVAWGVSRDVHVALGISLLEPFFQIICFSVHEHVWRKLYPGIKKTPHTCCAEAEIVSQVIETFGDKKA